MNKKNILITGASGFVGQHLSKHLESLDFNVFKISLKNKYKIPENIDVYIHLAGIEKDTLNVKNENDYYQVNSYLTRDIFQQFINSNARKFVFFSTIKVVSDFSNILITENTKVNPTTIYGKSKLLAESFILNEILPNDKHIFILRPTLIHGSEDRGNLKQLFNFIKKGFPWPLGAFENKRSFCSIDNLQFIINELIHRDDIPSGIYNVADDEPVSTNELINFIAQSQNRKPKVWNFSKSIIEHLARLGDKLHLPLNSERLQKLTDSYVVSNQKIKNAIGKSLPVSSKEGLVKTFHSFKK